MSRRGWPSLRSSKTHSFVAATKSRPGYASLSPPKGSGAPKDADLWCPRPLNTIAAGASRRATCAQVEYTIDAKSKIAGNQDFKFIGKANFHHKAGELHFVKHGKNVYVEGDIDGNGKADFQIQVSHVTKLAAADFDL